MVTKSNPQDACEKVMQLVRASQLNFCSKETPYSVFLTLRKSFTKNSSKPPTSSHQSVPQSQQVVETSKQQMEVYLTALQNEVLLMKIENSNLENDKVILTKNYQEELYFSENKILEFKQLESAHRTLSTNFQKLEEKSAQVKSEKTTLESKHSKVCLEQKALKSENNDL